MCLRLTKAVSHGPFGDRPEAFSLMTQTSSADRLRPVFHFPHTHTENFKDFSYHIVSWVKRDLSASTF